MSFASMSSVAITLFILGVFLLLAMNVNHYTHVVEGQVEVRVFLKKDTTDEQAEKVMKQIEGLPQVGSVNFITKEEGIAKWKQSFGEKAYLFDGLEGNENPLSDELAVKPKDPEETSLVAERVSSFPILKVLIMVKKRLKNCLVLPRSCEMLASGL